MGEQRDVGVGDVPVGDPAVPGSAQVREFLDASARELVRCSGLSLTGRSGWERPIVKGMPARRFPRDGFPPGELG
jgi:hypothetical protein